MFRAVFSGQNIACLTSLSNNGFWVEALPLSFFPMASQLEKPF